MGKLILYLAIWISTIATAVGQLKQISQINSDSYYLNSGNISLTVSKQGGRIVSLKFKSEEMLTQSGEHENFGSTLWISPQSNWGWPPYKVLDTENYTVTITQDSLWLQSKKDSVSGFQISKSIKSDHENCFAITYYIRNISKEIKKLDAWEVTRVPAGGIAFFEEGETATLPGSNLEGITRAKGNVWFQCEMKPLKEGQKLYASGKEGWLAYTFHHYLFIKQFPDILPESFTPQQGEVELYANEERKYFELENHGPYTTLAPGESLKYQVKWYLEALPQSIEYKIGNQELIAKVKALIKN